MILKSARPVLGWAMHCEKKKKKIEIDFGDWFRVEGICELGHISGKTD